MENYRYDVGYLRRKERKNRQTEEDTTSRHHIERERNSHDTP